MFWSFLVSCLLGLALLAGASGPVLAAGGIYFDDLLVTNNSAVVFSDHFDDGNMTDWGTMDWAALDSSQSHSAPFSLHLNHKERVVAEAFHRISITDPGVAEISSWIWLPPVQEQWGWSHNATQFTNLVLYSGSTTDNIAVGAELWPSEQGYRVRSHWNSSGGGGASQRTNQPVITPQRWVTLSLRLDSAAKTATSFLDGQQQLSFTYDPSRFASFDWMSCWGWLGDRQPIVPEPSSLAACLCGLGSLTAGVWRKRPVA